MHLARDAQLRLARIIALLALATAWILERAAGAAAMLACSWYQSVVHSHALPAMS